MRHKRKPPRPRKSPVSGDGDNALPLLLELERFSASSLHSWKIAKRKFDAIHSDLYFGLEAQRQQHSKLIQEALRRAVTGPFRFENWGRMADYRYTLEPLSMSGSVKGDGGRFNIGGELNPSSFTPFPALYIAENYDTALRERLGAGASGLQPMEMALRSPASFTYVRVKGNLESVIDVGRLDSLRPLADVLKEFEMPKNVQKLARDIGLKRPPSLVRSPLALQQRLLDRNWRASPVQYGLPANTQIFGRMVNGAGIHGILYPSARNKAHQCLALFPQNWAGSTSFVEVIDAVPASARSIRWDGASRVFA
ncbi:MAG: RES family NAD+ phosphorylase [Gallionellaceae bacterium]|jgi:RES domain-containing protein|nr:RES family NAD+ phosphorylase [Gallionellaceae bacterium]